MIQTGRKCNVAGCEKFIAGKGLCQTHYMRQYRHGHLTSTRPQDWGGREKHPLYQTYRYIVRCYGKDSLCNEWKDFWQFVKDVGEKKNGHQFKRIDVENCFSKENVYWSITESEPDKNEYQKSWRKNNPDYEFSTTLHRYFNLTIEDYYRMWNEQNGKCGICNQPEKAISVGKGKTRRLAVDHCHVTKKIRGLLCSSCNTALGSFGDSQELLERASAYLRSHTT